MFLMASVAHGTERDVTIADLRNGITVNVGDTIKLKVNAFAYQTDANDDGPGGTSTTTGDPGEAYALAIGIGEPIYDGDTNDGRRACLTHMFRTQSSQEQDLRGVTRTLNVPATPGEYTVWVAVMRTQLCKFADGRPFPGLYTAQEDFYPWGYEQNEENILTLREPAIIGTVTVNSAG